jgi:hypothetical protein
LDLFFNSIDVANMLGGILRDDAMYDDGPVLLSFSNRFLYSTVVYILLLDSSQVDWNNNTERELR